MAKLLKMFIVLMSLGLVVPSIVATEDKATIDAEEMEDFDLKSLEEELRRLLEDSEKEVLAIPETEEKLEVEYTEPMTDAFKKELKAQPEGKEEIIILGEDEGNELDEDIHDDLYQ